MAAFNESNALVGTGDPLPWLREFCDPDIELDLSRRAIDPDIYQGYEGFMRLGEQDANAWHESRFEVEDVIDAGESIVLFRTTRVSPSPASNSAFGLVMS